MSVKELASTKLNSLTVKLFEYDIDNEQSFTDLKEYLVKKIKKSKVHNVNLNYYGSKNLNPTFVKNLMSKLRRLRFHKSKDAPV